MKLKSLSLSGLIMGLLGTTMASPADQLISKKNAHDVIDMLDEFREEVEPPAEYMPKLQYDFAFAKSLHNIIVEKGPSWLYEPSNMKGVARQGWNIYWVADLVNSSMTFGWHDTCNRAGAKCIKYNLMFRAAQKNCLSYQKCSSTIANGFRSCMLVPLPTGPSTHCSYAFNYYPYFVDSQVRTVACLVFGIPGPNAPHNQQNSYGCWINKFNAINDKPYVAKLTR